MGTLRIQSRRNQGAGGIGPQILADTLALFPLCPQYSYLPPPPPGFSGLPTALNACTWLKQPILSIHQQVTNSTAVLLLHKLADLKMPYL